MEAPMTRSFTLLCSHRREALVLAGTTLLAACSTPPQEAAATDEVQISNSAYFWVAPTATSAAHDPEHATGTLFAPIRSHGDGVTDTIGGGTTLRFSCGVTFVSPRYAVTAGHCVDTDSVVDLARDLVTVQMYRFPAGYDWLNASTLSGGFPNITHPSISGYASDIVRFSCRVVSRCYHNNSGDVSVNCPIATSTADVALLRCDTDVASRGFTWLDVAAADDLSQVPYMPWTHEVYFPPDAGTALAGDFHDHYTVHNATTNDGHYPDNFHYWGTRPDGSEVNQLVQLVSTPWPNGPDRRKLGLDTYGVETDLGGCHGTSGSGVLQWNATKSAYELLGPVVLGAGNAWSDATDRLLCEDATKMVPGQPALVYGPVDQTRTMAAKATDCAWSGDSFPDNTCSCGANVGPCPAEAPACVDGQCSCAPKVDPCGAYQNCGFADDGCGGRVACGTCSSGFTCNSGVCERGTSCCPAHCPSGKVCDPGVCACVLPE
jgi:hypothetical protein